ncbi:MAG: hypothetical protein R2774_16205 [Saprospiraceae bacterium]
MKFFIDTYKDIRQYFWQQQLVYIPEEHSFYMDSIVNKIEVELIVNKISLAVSDHIVVSVSGFCGLSESMKSNYQVPKYKKGGLRVEHNLNYGFAYGINDDDYEYPVYVNVQSGWVCIGNPEKKGNAVEFINNCVAVIDNDKEFVSLWLKPESLPEI